MDDFLKNMMTILNILNFDISFRATRSSRKLFSNAASDFDADEIITLSRTKTYQESPSLKGIGKESTEKVVSKCITLYFKFLQLNRNFLDMYT